MKTALFDLEGDAVPRLIIDGLSFVALSKPRAELLFEVTAGM